MENNNKKTLKWCFKTLWTRFERHAKRVARDHPHTGRPYSKGFVKQVF